MNRPTLSQADIEGLNRWFREGVTSSDPVKTAQMLGLSGDYVIWKLRDESFLDKVLPPEPKSPAEAQRNVEDNALYFIRDVEIDTMAFELSNVGAPANRYVNGRRYRIPVWRKASERYQIHTYDLYAYQYPLKAVLDDHIVKDIGERDDHRFTTIVQSLIALNEATFAADPAKNFMFSSVLDATGGPDFMDRDLLKDSFNLLDGRRSSAATLLMHVTRANDILSWPQVDVGNEIATEITRNGSIAFNWLGKNWITTNKEWFNPSIIHLFAPPSMLGHHYVIDTVEVLMENRFKLLEWEGNKYSGFGLGNYRSVGQIELPLRPGFLAGQGGEGVVNGVLLHLHKAEIPMDRTGETVNVVKL